MKQKIYTKLKQAYTQLGLGDGVLQAHAESLANLGLVTDDNIDSVILAQKTFLEGLQKFNDTRASEAARTAEERVRRQIEEETKKKEEERKKAEEEAAKAKAEEEARIKAEKAAEKKAKEEAERKKAEEEAERKRLEEIAKQNEMPEYLKKYFEERAEKEKADKERIEAESRKKDELAKRANDELMKTLQAMREQNDALRKSYDAMKEESDKAKEESARKARKEFIINKAKELSIPQYRIDEGFAISESDDDATIESYLSKVAGNIKTNSLPDTKSFKLGDESPTKAEADAIAKMMIR